MFGQHIHTYIHSLTCGSLPSAAVFVTEMTFSDSEDSLFTVGLSVIQLQHKNIMTLATESVLTISSQFLKDLNNIAFHGKPS